MKLGYARRSPLEKDFAPQVKALKQAGCQKIYKDAGMAFKRPALTQCLRALKSGDTLVVWRLDALAPTLHDVIVRVIELHQRGMKMLSLSEPLNTAAAEGAWIFKAFSALRACERNLLIERTHQGRIKARSSGMRLGPKPKLSSQQITQALALIEAGQARDAVAALLKVSRSTLYRALLAHEASRVWQLHPPNDHLALLAR